jgi:hypothetical protein
MIKKLIYIIASLMIAGSAFGANVYIDPDCDSGGAHHACGDGYLYTTPTATYPNIVSSDDYRQLCGTSISTTISISNSGVFNNYIIIGAYNVDGSHEEGKEEFGNLCSGGEIKPIIDNVLDDDDVNAILTPLGGSSWIEINSIKITDVDTAIRVKSNDNIFRYCYIYNVYWGLIIGLGNSGDDGYKNIKEYNYNDMNDSTDE